MVVLLAFLKRINLFNTYTTDEKTIQHERLTTRIYLILLPTILTILIIYSAQKELYHTAQVNNPSLDTYKRLFNAYPDTLLCPCSQLSIPYESFVNLTPRFHSVCSSDFVSDAWLQYLYKDDASFYLAIDIRSVGNTQFQLLRTLCQSSREAIDNAFQATFASASLINSRGMVLPSELVQIQVEIFVNAFINNIANEQRRQRSLFTTFIERNYLVSALETSAIPFIDPTQNLKMQGNMYPHAILVNGVAIVKPTCYCDQTYNCGTLLMICDISYYTLDFSEDTYRRCQVNQLTTVTGFQSGCLPLNSLLVSTLECYHDHDCLNKVTSHLSPISISLNILDRNLLNQSILTTSIGALADNLMVEQWSTEIDHAQYFATCRPLSCSYSYTERFSMLYIVTTLMGLFGGLIAILRLICPQLTNILYRIRNSILMKDKNNFDRSVPLEQRQSFMKRIHQLFNKLRDTLITFNLFSRRDSDVLDVRQQILTTRFYISCLAIFALILVSITSLDQRTITIILSLPTVAEFENLYQSGKIPHSCPCSQIAIERSQFISLVPTFHQVCSSQLLSDDWLDRLTFTNDPRSTYYLDVRSYGVEMLRTVRSFCILTNDTIIDSLTDFLDADFVSIQVLPRQQFREQMELLIIDLQSSVENRFEQVSSIARHTTQGNQVLVSRLSNFFFEGLFDSYGYLTGVQTYTGIKSLLNDTLPSCSCVLTTCSQQLGIFDYNPDDQTFTLAVSVPGMYSACYPLDALRLSTFECWFNLSCIELILSKLKPFPAQPSLEPLNSSMLIRFTPSSTIDDIINDLMIEKWTNITNYERYYNSCRPSTCTYTSYRRLDWLYTTTILMSVFGGLSVSLRIICPLLIKLYFNRQQQRQAVSTTSKSTVVREGIIARTLHQVRRVLLTTNLFDSQSPHQHIQRREHLSTRLYIISLIIMTIFLFCYMLFEGHTRTATEQSPSSNLIAQLQTKYAATLSCPCMQTSISYSTFLSLQVVQYHPICSSSFLSRDYLHTLLGDNLLVTPESTSFKRQFLASQLSLLADYCVLAGRTVNTSLNLFLRQQLITAQVLTADQFDNQINTTIYRFLLDMSFSLRHSLNYFQEITHGNTIMSTYVSNWRFVPSFEPYYHTIRTRPVWYGNCSCASSSQCSSPMTIGNTSFPGLFIGCLPSSVLLQSTFQCFYNQTCLDDLHNALFDNVTISSLPVSINRSSHFAINSSIGSLFDELFVESWFREYDYEAFFRTCNVSMCTYTYMQQPDILYVVTTIIGLFGGLTIVFRLLSPLLIIGCINLIDFIRKKSSSPVQLYTPATSQAITVVSFCSASNDIVGIPIQPDVSAHWLQKSRCKQIMYIASIILAIVVIILSVSPSIINRSSLDNIARNVLNASNMKSTVQLSSSTVTVAPTTLCSPRAKWKKEAVTVAGFGNDTSPTSVASLRYPFDLSVDGFGNMHIADFNNHRILYWPVNSTEGRIVAGTGEFGSEANQLWFPTRLTIGKRKIYVLDTGNDRIQSFPYITVTGSPNGTTILGAYLPDSNRNPLWAFSGMSYDWIRHLLYVCDISNQRLIILNATGDDTEIIANVQLSVISPPIQISPLALIINPVSDSFYVTDPELSIAVQFTIGSTTGTIIAGPMINNSTANLLGGPIDLALDSSGYLYITDVMFLRVIQLLNNNGDLRTIAGNGLTGTSATRLTSPYAIDFDQYNNLYVADSSNNRIQRFDLLQNGC